IRGLIHTQDYLFAGSFLSLVARILSPHRQWSRILRSNAFGSSVFVLGWPPRGRTSKSATLCLSTFFAILQPTWAEDKATLGSDLSADPGPKTEAGCPCRASPLVPSRQSLPRIGTKR